MLGQVLVERLETIPRHWHLLPLVPFAMDDQQAQFAIYITQPQTDNLTTPQAASTSTVTMAWLRR